MKKHKITVYDKRFSVLSEMTKLEVKAYCVSGPEGIFAIFDDPNNNDCFYMAGGDDGAWWVIGHYHKQWLKKIKTSIQLFSEDIKDEDKNGGS